MRIKDKDKLEDDQLIKAVEEIAKNHRKIIDDWCKAYLAQLYEEGIDIKPGCFVLNEQMDMVLENGKIGKRYWFSIKEDSWTETK